MQIIETVFKAIGYRIDEVGYTFFEGRPFVHKPGCKNVRLARQTDRVGNKHRTTRSCISCGKSDVIETFVVDRIF